MNARSWIIDHKIGTQAIHSLLNDPRSFRIRFNVAREQARTSDERCERVDHWPFVGVHEKGKYHEQLSTSLFWDTIDPIKIYNGDTVVTNAKA